MALAVHRRMMTAPNAPLVRAAFDAAPRRGSAAGCSKRRTPLAPYCQDELRSHAERRPLDDINRVNEAVRHREIKRRAILVP